MYKEQSKATSKQKNLAFFGVMGALLLTYVVFFLLSFFKISYSVIIMFLMLGVMTYFIYRLIKYSLTGYVYIIEDTAFSVKSVIGSKETLSCYTEIKNIISVENEEKSKFTKDKADFVIKAASSTDAKNRYVMIFKDNKKRAALIFTPTGELLEKMKEAGVKVK